MIEIKLEEASSLTLEMQIEGDVKGETPEMRFSIMSEGLRYSFPATLVEAGVYQIEFPQMLGKIVEGEYQAAVEIIVDGKYFQPLTETVKFTKEVKPIVKMNETAAPKVQPAAVSVKMGKMEKAPAAPKVEMAKISDVKGIVTHLVENNSVNTTLALTYLNFLAEGKKFEDLDENIVIDPSHKANEAEVLATLKLLNRNGTDVTSTGVVDTLMKISERVSNELRELFLKKGLPARDLQDLL